MLTVYITDMNTLPKQKEIAEWLGITKQSLSNYLNEYRRPGAKIAKKLEDVSGISVRHWLYSPGRDLRTMLFIAYKLRENK